MGQFDLNLSTQPFRAFKLKSFLLMAAMALLVVISAAQGYGFLRYTRRAARIRGEEQSAQVESAVLGRRLAEMDSTLNRPESTAKMTEIEFLNGIITRKTFSWTSIFANLEDLMPDGVHLISIHPDFSGVGPVVLHIDVTTRGMMDIKQLIEAMQSSPAFGPVDFFVQTKETGVTGGMANSDIAFSLTVPYHPERDGQ